LTGILNWSRVQFYHVGLQGYRKLTTLLAFLTGSDTGLGDLITGLILLEDYLTYFATLIGTQQGQDKLANMYNGLARWPR